MNVNFLASINQRIQTIIARSSSTSFRNEVNVASIDIDALKTDREKINGQIKTLEDEIDNRDGIETEDETVKLADLNNQFVSLNQKIDRGSRRNARSQALNSKVDVLKMTGSLVSSQTNNGGEGSETTVVTEGPGNVAVTVPWEQDSRLGYNNIGEFLNDVRELGENATASDKVRFLMNQDGGFTRGEGLVVPRGFANNGTGTHMPGDAGTDVLRPAPAEMPLMRMPTNDHDALFNAMMPTPIPMARPEVKVPFLRDKDRRHELFAGIFVTDRPDQAALERLSKMNFGKLEMKVGGTYTLACFHELLLAESPVSLLTLFTSNSSIAMQRARIRYMLRGSSTRHFDGILKRDQNPSLITIGRTQAGTTSYDDLLDMRNHCYGYGGAMWLASTDTLTDVEKLNRILVNAGAPAIFSYSAEMNSGILMGRPFIVSDDFQTADGLALINAAHYYHGTYQSEMFGENPYLLWLEDKKIFKVTKREVGNVAWECPLIPELNNVPKSPFVVLGAEDYFPECPESDLKEYRIQRAVKFTERPLSTANANAPARSANANAPARSANAKGSSKKADAKSGDSKPESKGTDSKPSDAKGANKKADAKSGDSKPESKGKDSKPSDGK